MKTPEHIEDVYNVLYDNEMYMILNSSDESYFLQDEDGNTINADKEDCEILFEV